MSCSFRNDLISADVALPRKDCASPLAIGCVSSMMMSTSGECSA